MKDESSHLLPARAADAQQPPIIHLPLFRPGTRVNYKGQTCTVGHIVVSRSQLLVHLKEIDTQVDAEKIELAPTPIPLARH